MLASFSSQQLQPFSLRHFLAIVFDTLPTIQYHRDDSRSDFLSIRGNIFVGIANLDRRPGTCPQGTGDIPGRNFGLLIHTCLSSLFLLAGSRLGLGWLDYVNGLGVVIHHKRNTGTLSKLAGGSHEHFLLILAIEDIDEGCAALLFVGTKAYGIPIQLGGNLLGADGTGGPCGRLGVEAYNHSRPDASAATAATAGRLVLLTLLVARIYLLQGSARKWMGRTSHPDVVGALSVITWSIGGPFYVRRFRIHIRMKYRRGQDGGVDHLVLLAACLRLGREA
mmetsp:Transcript_30936/g.90446  ORF Transcript_30936/g.90446 Transcript_30936/m.90446 type:complete len:279 (-) Transcript_30936:1190-2026(-)